MPGINISNIDDVLSYHAPSGDQPKQYEAIRQAAKQFAWEIMINTSPSADQQAAIRHVREAMMTANAAVALKGTV